MIDREKKEGERERGREGDRQRVLPPVCVLQPSVYMCNFPRPHTLVHAKNRLGLQCCHMSSHTSTQQASPTSIFYFFFPLDFAKSYHRPRLGIAKVFLNQILERVFVFTFQSSSGYGKVQDPRHMALKIPIKGEEVWGKNPRNRTRIFFNIVYHKIIPFSFSLLLSFSLSFPVFLNFVTCIMCQSFFFIYSLVFSPFVFPFSLYVFSLYIFRYIIFPSRYIHVNLQIYLNGNSNRKFQQKKVVAI